MFICQEPALLIATMFKNNYVDIYLLVPYCYLYNVVCYIISDLLTLVIEADSSQQV